jgi:hypothetical protein
VVDTSIPPAPATPPTSVEREVQGAGHDREALQALRRGYQARIAKRSDDFEASRGLRLVEQALKDTSREGNPWDKAVRKLVRDSSAS